jgi:hypothetical protein
VFWEFAKRKFLTRKDKTRQDKDNEDEKIRLRNLPAARIVACPPSKRCIQLLVKKLILSFRVANFLFANSQSTQPHFITGKKKTPWSESASELYRPSDRRLSAK